MKPKSWIDGVDIREAGDIGRLVNEYRLFDIRLPAPHAKIKVYEGRNGFTAYCNLSFRDVGGSPVGEAGMGLSEAAALQRVIDHLMRRLAERAVWNDEDFEWTDARDF